MNTIPRAEIEAIMRLVAVHPDYFDTSYMIGAYLSYGLEVIPHGFSADIIAPICAALQRQTPFSVLRIGDGEANLLTYQAYPDAENLDYRVIKAAIERWPDSFRVEREWMVVIRDWLRSAVAQADMLGVIGLWRIKPNVSWEIMMESTERFTEHCRAFSGHWRAMDFMLRLASQGYLANKIITSAHLYFAVLENLDSLIPLAREVYVISCWENVIEGLKTRYPQVGFHFISVGQRPAPEAMSDKPDFLFRVHDSLPPDMRGCLCLVGAGPWAEIYCTWVKLRGGVGVDIGSGCDLLDGTVSRHIHKAIGVEKMAKYKL